MNFRSSITHAVEVANGIQAFARRARPKVAQNAMLRALPFWLAAAISGLFSVGFAFVFDRASEFSVGIFHSEPFWAMVGAPFCFLIAWALVYFLAPDAAGSGIPQVMAASQLVKKRNHAAGDRLLSMKTAFVKVLSCLVCVLGGGAVGREGPTIQIASSIFYSFGRKAQFLFQDLSLRPFIIAGGAAGVASAFNTPLGGIVFAIEELARARFHVFKAVLIFSVVVAGLISQQILGPYLYFGFPAIGPTDPSLLPLAVLVGCVTGLFGGLFGKMLEIAIDAKRRLLKGPWQLGALAMLCGLAIAINAYFFGTPVIGPGKKMITDILFDGESASWVIAAGRFFSSLISYIAGSAGGIFAPSLATGAAIGQKIAVIAGTTNINLMVLLGMIGFLTGVTRAPFTSFVLVLEMTDRHSAIIFMMLAAICAYGVSHLVSTKSFYEQMEAIYIEKYKTT